jgi:hypothetical protein
MKHVVVFQDYNDDLPHEAYESVADEANAWLQKHPKAQIVASHTNLKATHEWTEFALTLIVELPD